MAKKITLFFALCLIVTAHRLQATAVSGNFAKSTAISLFNAFNKTNNASLSLAYAETSANGDTLYYVFNAITTKGFIIIAGDDAAHPLIGYSTESEFHAPDRRSPFAGWLVKKKEELLRIKAYGPMPTEAVKQEWHGNENSIAKFNGQQSQGAALASVTPLLKTTWDQFPFYNDSCPGSKNALAVTGCVATAMAQIMKYWSFPTKGTGYASYCDCGSPNFTTNYGTLHANFGNTTYNWANMPNALTSANANIAQLMYHCAVSVNMDFGTQGSSAWVISKDDTISAQNAFVKYFGYDPVTIKGVYRFAYNDSTWEALLLNELNAGRPLEYVGDSAGKNGHTWVCDGYDATSNTFHMNWGWGGQCNGYYSLKHLDPPSNPRYSFPDDEEVLVGIEPIRSAPPVSDFTALDPSVCGSGKVSYRDQSSNLATSWSWTFPGGIPAASSAPNPVVSYSKPGFYTATLVATNGAGKGTTMTKTNFVNVGAAKLTGATCTPQTYYLTGHDYGFGVYNFTLGTINNTSGSAMDDGGYRDFSCFNNTVLKPATTYSLSMNVGAYQQSHVKVWIDYNNNGSLSDPGELIYKGDNISGVINASFTTASNPTLSTYLRLRIITDYDTIPEACETSWGGYVGNGQAEDYAVYFNTPAGITPIASLFNDAVLFPNPNSGRATLQLELSQNAKVSIQVLDLMGRELESLSPSYLLQGVNQVNLDLVNLPQGLYFVKVQSEGATKVLRMQLVK